MDEPKSRGVWPWVLGALGVPLLYVLSFGPACREAAVPARAFTSTTTNEPLCPGWFHIYRPLAWIASRCDPARNALEELGRPFMPPGYELYVPVGRAHHLIFFVQPPRLPGAVPKS